MRSKIKGGSCKADKTQDQLNLFRAKLVSAKLLSKQLQSGKLLSVKLFLVKLSRDETIFSGIYFQHNGCRLNCFRRNFHSMKLTCSETASGKISGAPSSGNHEQCSEFKVSMDRYPLPVTKLPPVNPLITK